MFAMGAAAGALIATAVQEVLQRRKKTPLEKVAARAAAIMSDGTDYTRDLQEKAGSYVAGLSKQSRKQSRQARKQARKRSKLAAKQVTGLKEAAAGALGAVAVSSVVDQAREYVDGAQAKRRRGSKKAGSWFNSVGQTAADAQPTTQALKWWKSAAASVGDQVDSARDASSNVQVADTVAEAAKSARGLMEIASEALQEYLGQARGTVADAGLGAKARSVAETARERLEEAGLADRARDAVTVAGSTLKDVAETARERLDEAKLADRARDAATVATGTLKDVAVTARERLDEADLGSKAREYSGVAADTVKDYSAKAGQAARTSAEKLGEGASYVAETTAGSAKDLQQGVRKSVKRTRRRINWGLRAFIIGLVVGVLTAPQSGERTRVAMQSFVENILELVMPDNEFGSSSS